MSARTSIVTDDPTLDDYKEQGIWLAWQLEPRDDDPEVLTKVPYSPHGDLRTKGRSNDPNTWGTWAEACARATRLPRPCGEGGVGIVTGSNGKQGLAAIDLDNCRDADNGELEEWAAEVIERFNSYCEISPSGTGVHLLFRYNVSDLPRLTALLNNGRRGREFNVPGKKHTGFAPYLSNKYFTVTETHLEDTPTTLRLVPFENIEWLVNEAGPAVQAQKQGTANGNRSHKGTGTRRGLDYTASGIADKMALALRRAGCTYDEMVDKLRTEDATHEWVTTKGELRNQRELKRIWERAGNTIEMEANAPEIAKMNQEFAVVLVGGSAAVLREYVDNDGRPKMDLLTPKAFLTWMQNKYLVVGEKSVPLGKYWLSHSKRRQYESIVFEPNQQTPGHYNLWKGFAVQPKKGDCSKFLDHVLVNICQRDETLFVYVIGFCAQMVQFPEKKIGTALAFKGEQGTGKSIFGKNIGSLFPEHYVPVADPQYITGTFNKHLRGCLLLHADEGFWAGDHAAEGKLKDLVTGEEQMIQPKFIDAFKTKNFIRLLVTGNPKWVVPAALRERRFVVLEMGLEHQEDHAYFAAIEKQMEEGGREALLYHLLDFDLSRVNLRSIPKTAALLDQKIESLTSEQAWWLDVLTAGRLPGRQHGHMVSKKALFDHYQTHANRSGFKRRSIETALGRFLKQMVRGLRSYEDQIFYDGDGKQYISNAYTFPSLDTCRRQFCEILDQELPWDGDDGWR